MLEKNLQALLGKTLKIYLRRDSQSKHIPEFISGTLRFIDPRSGLMIVQGGNNRYIFPNRGAIAYIEVNYE